MSGATELLDTCKHGSDDEACSCPCECHRRRDTRGRVKDWICPDCGTHNNEARYKCRICAGVPAPTSLEAVQSALAAEKARADKAEADIAHLMSILDLMANHLNTGDPVRHWAFMTDREEHGERIKRLTRNGGKE